MPAPATVETARLLLRAPRASDATAMFERYAGDPEVTRYVGWPRHRGVADTQAFLAFSEAQWSKDGVGAYLIHSKTGGRLLGSTGLALDNSTEAAGAMTGYVLAQDAWGQGFATEALTAMIEVSRGILVGRLFALCHPEHRASQHVLEKCGFVRDGSWTTPMEFPNLDPGRAQAVLCYAREI